jgi:hypothetical protein
VSSWAMASRGASWRSTGAWACAGRSVAARATLGDRRGQITVHEGRWGVPVAVVTLLACTVLAAGLATRATAAFPGRNGVIAYFWPDPEADLAYLAFASPDGAVASDWVAGWKDTDIGEPAFSPDGLRVAVSFEGRRHNAIAVATAPSMRVHAITYPRGNDLDRAPSWSPDGGSIVFERDDGHQTGLLYTMRADGSRLRRLVRGELPAWSTLGQIAFTRFSHGGNRSSIYTISAAAGHVRRLTSGAHDQGGDWSPDGHRFVFERGGEIYTVHAAGGTLRRRTSCRGLCTDPSFSPDGTQIVFITGRKLVITPEAGGQARTFRCEEPGCFGTDWLPAPTAALTLPRTGGSAGTLAVAGLALLAIGLATRPWRLPSRVGRDPEFSVTSRAAPTATISPLKRNVPQQLQ